MKYKITPQILRAIAGAPVNANVVDGLVKYLPPLMFKYKLNNHLRVAHFLAQICHETDHFRTLEEYASGAAYEGREDLGNTRKGDGKRYKGRGAIQLTGRFNYRKYGQKIGVDLENNPELAKHPENSIKTALEYWTANNLNTYADQDNVKMVTRRINGGFNGLQSRIDMTKRAKYAVKTVEFQDNDLNFDPPPAPAPVAEKPKPTPVPAPTPTPKPVAAKPVEKPPQPATIKIKEEPKVSNVKLSQPKEKEPGEDASKFVRSQLNKKD